MIWAARQLLVPVNYLRIRHGKGIFYSKRYYDFVLPIVMSGITCFIFSWLGISLSVFSHDELVKRITDILVLMIVFYMAALAAVATFDRKGIDDKLKGDDALLSVRRLDGKGCEDKKLSYRQFISYLFGYLSFLSLCLYMFIAIFALLWPSLELHFSENEIAESLLREYIAPFIFFLVFVAIWQLMITSLLGIYFLTERIQSLNEPKS